MSDDRLRFGDSGETSIDRAIDRAVRRMMRIDPPAGLRRRVLARIEAPPSRSNLLPRAAFAAAALAAVVVGSMVIRRHAEPPPSPGPVATRAPSIERPVAPAAPAPVTPAPRVQAGREPASRGELIKMPKIRNVFGPPTGRLTATTIDEPLAVAPESDVPVVRPLAGTGGPPPIVIRDISIPPVEVEQLRVAPIRPPR